MKQKLGESGRWKWSLPCICCCQYFHVDRVAGAGFIAILALYHLATWQRCGDRTYLKENRRRNGVAKSESSTFSAPLPFFPNVCNAGPPSCACLWTALISIDYKYTIIFYYIQRSYSYKYHKPSRHASHVHPLRPEKGHRTIGHAAWSAGFPEKCWVIVPSMGSLTDL